MKIKTLSLLIIGATLLVACSAAAGLSGGDILSGPTRRGRELCAGRRDRPRVWPPAARGGWARG